MLARSLFGFADQVDLGRPAAVHHPGGLSAPQATLARTPHISMSLGNSPNLPHTTGCDPSAVRRRVGLFLRSAEAHLGISDSPLPPFPAGRGGRGCVLCRNPTPARTLRTQNTQPRRPPACLLACLLALADRPLYATGSFVDRLRNRQLTHSGRQTEAGNDRVAVSLALAHSPPPPRVPPRPVGPAPGRVDVTCRPPAMP